MRHLLVLSIVVVCAVSRPGAADDQGGVKYFPAADVEASSARAARSSRRRVPHHDRTRTGGGEAELHSLDRDIFHVLEGSATFVTGGTLVGAHETAPGETRATSIEGGVTQTLQAGDVITIPKGVPHWFKAVDGRVRYFVVKVRD